MPEKIFIKKRLALRKRLDLLMLDNCKDVTHVTSKRLFWSLFSDASGESRFSRISQIWQGYPACCFLFPVGQFTEDEQRSIISPAGIPRGSMHGLKSNPTSITLILFKLWHG
jgi:hypothetical protein